MKEMTRVALMSVLLLLGGCHKAAQDTAAASAPAPAPEKAATAAESAEGVALKPEEIEKLGIVTAEAVEITSAPESSGFGVVVVHDTLAQAVAELRTAVAAERQSRAAFERTHRLAGTPGAMPGDTQETAERQAAADRATLELAKQRLSATLGQNLPWKDAANSPELLALASGQAKLIRVTFPLGSPVEGTPARVRFAHLDVGAGATGPGAAGWQSTEVWRAPADTTVPGKSFFAVVKEGDASEGEHVLAWSPVGTPEKGVLVPAAAAVVSGGKFWCYLEKEQGTFTRVEFDPDRPVTGGYFVKEGMSPGDKIVTAAAGLLLARETNPSTEAD